MAQSNLEKVLEDLSEMSVDEKRQAVALALTMARDGAILNLQEKTRQVKAQLPKG